MTANTILKGTSLRATPIRLRVIDVLLDSIEAISSKDIELALEDLDRITLYRTIKTFEEKGIIHKAHDGTPVVKYALCASGCSEHAHHDQHVHFRCQKCDKTFCIDEVKMPTIQVPEGYKTRETQVILTGMCIKCNNVA